MKTLFSTGLLLGLLTFGAQGAVTQIGGEHQGNDDLATVQGILNAYFQTTVDLQLYDKYDNGSNLVNVTGYPGQSGTWDVIDNTVLITYVTVKAGNEFLLFHYNPSVNSGTWSTEGLLNNGGNQPNLSHLSFWTGAQPGGDEPPGVPEPMTMGLLGSGLATFILVRKFRK